MVGVKVSLFSAALRLASVPLMVSEDELLEPEMNVKPLIEPSVRVPCVSLSVSCSLPFPASGSVTLMALLFAVEKTSDEFSFTLTVVGALTAGPWGLVTVSGSLPFVLATALLFASPS